MREAVVIFHEETDGTWAESPDAPGWTAVAPSLIQLFAVANEGLAFYFDEPVHLVQLIYKPPAGPTTAASSVVPVMTIGGALSDWRRTTVRC